MALRFRSLLPFAIPGVLALIGWWWFSSRKKEHTSNHDRRDLASLEECRIGSHKRRPDSAENWAPSSKDDRQADCKLAPPSEMERPAEAWLLPDVSHPVKAASPEQRAQSFGCSADLPVPSGTTAESETLQDDSKKLDITVVSQDALGRPAQEPPLLSQMTNDSHGVDVTAGGKPESSPSGKQVPRVGDLVELPPLEESLGDNLEKKRTGGVSLDEEEVEKIEQVAIHIISQVILAATEEVLSSSVSDMTDRLCQMAAGHIDKPLEKVASGAVCPAESNKGSHCASEKAAVGCAALLEENAHHHATFSSRLTHGLLANPSHSWPRDSTRVGQAAGEPAPFANHKEELEDVPVVAEFSGCSSCTSEDGGRAEDLLRNGSSPVSRQQQDLSDESAVKDSEHSSAPLKNPLSPALPETQVPYSNGVLREDCLDLQHEQPWPAEADADHSGGSDVNSMDSVDSGCQNLGTESNKMELVIWEIEVPKHLVGRLIGKQGRYVSFLKQASGAKIYISTVSYAQDFQICHIEGSQQNVDKALSLIGKKFKDLSLNNIYALPPPMLPLHSLPMTSWLMLPDGVTVEVIVVNQVNAGHLFVQQHTHPTFHVLRSLDEQMYLCYSQPGIPTMPTPVEVGVVCAAPGVDGAWWRAQVVGYFKDSGEVEIRYVDYGGYERVKIDTLRQIRSDFVTLPFQGTEVLLDNIVPLPDEDHFSSEADIAVSEMTRGTPLLAQVTNYDSVTGLPLIQLWSMMGDELVSINRTMVERGFAKWIESY
ncbi:A-kinase anchor protein 1, mitochondrial [Sphaerodactylus townsendi]|uniref:A-kinase anchor protein 1, mitochondrial n=1 Tax=Sphaerodactylus townsendi TaxID=933632 RepID=UPI0020276A83|nr:A-kinase anchor protein 1, mitochondrial [Sphaerodactylus townsendi]XP_048375027.1 A-kinase anchor protein 1, mitochondrial [Sphaerodactylus townsendi]